jgi:peptide/nickel transport system ATP-binding protein
MTETPLLQVEDLRVSYQGRVGPVPAVRGISFTLGRERLGIVGESGAGKSTIGRAILGLLPNNAKVTARQLRLHDVDLLHASKRAPAISGAGASPWCCRIRNSRSTRS